MSPMSSMVTYSGARMPHTGQNAIMNNNEKATPSPVDSGIMFGQYMSHGAVTFKTSGRYTVKYKNIPTLEKKQTMARFSANLAKIGRKIESHFIGAHKLRCEQISYILTY